MDNVLFYCYLAFMILIPTLSALGGSGHGDSLTPSLLSSTALALSATIAWRRLRWVPVSGEMVGESGHVGYYNVATYAWRYEFCGLAYEASDVVPNLAGLLDTRRHGTVWVDPDHPLPHPAPELEGPPPHLPRLRRHTGLRAAQKPRATLMDGVSAAPQSSPAHTTRRVRRDMYAEGPSPIRADPSGTVVDAATGEPVPGAGVTLWYAPLPGVDPEPWDASPWGQENPLATDGGGRFSWEVPEGWWQVRVEAEGYWPAQSEWVRMPAATEPDLQIGLRPASLPQPGGAACADCSVAPGPSARLGRVA